MTAGMAFGRIAGLVAGVGQAPRLARQTYLQNLAQTAPAIFARIVDFLALVFLPNVCG